MVEVFTLLIVLFWIQLQDYTEYMGSAARVILVPSIRDASHDFVFPQVLLYTDSVRTILYHLVSQLNLIRSVYRITLL